MTKRAPKQLRPLLAYALALLAGALIFRDFGIGGGLQRADAVEIDSTGASINAHRLNHHAGELPDLGAGLQNLQLTEASTYQGTGRNIFSVEFEQSDKPTVPQRQFIEQKSPPPMMDATFPLKFFGFSRSGNTRSIFLLKENDVFIAHEGDIVARRYKIVRVAHNSAQVEDLLSNQRQELWFRETP